MCWYNAHWMDRQAFPFDNACCRNGILGVDRPGEGGDNLVLLMLFES